MPSLWIAAAGAAKPIESKEIMPNTNRSPEEWTRHLADLAGTTISEQVRAAQRGTDIVVRYGRGELPTDAFWNETVRFARDETVRYTRSAATLGTTYLDILASLGKTYTGLVADTMSPSKVPSARQHVAKDSGDVPTEARVITVELTAPIGEVASKTILLENAHSTDAQITFLASDWVSNSEGVPFAADLRFHPTRLTLASGESRSVSLTLSMTAESFAAGERYTAQALVRGIGDIALNLVALPTEAIKTAAQEIGMEQVSLGTDAIPPSVETASVPRPRRKTAK